MEIRNSRHVSLLTVSLRSLRTERRCNDIAMTRTQEQKDRHAANERAWRFAKKKEVVKVKATTSKRSTPAGVRSPFERKKRKATVVSGTPVDRRNAAPAVPNTAPPHLKAMLMSPELLKYNLEMARMMQELRIHASEDIKYLGDKVLQLGNKVLENCAAGTEDLTGLLVGEEEK
jgi:hypothetical protein